MALPALSRLGPYDVVALLGRGGMGEVYRARDTKLNRDVAIKILPAAMAADPERIARFKREAQVLASLNHPNIAAIYGFEDAGGTHALVLELVEGPTLADRIARGAIPLDEALPIAKQIAEALEAAHEQGIIHRDLKPANIKVKDDGTVKVLDFGLAKALAPDAASATARDLAQSPTITSPAMTQAGMILGTAAYMSPEQARGQAVDKRADIWAFGCVLFEMLTGARAFPGEDVTDTLAAVLMKEPDWTAVPATVPPAVVTVVRRCLQKDRRQRVRDIGDVSFALEGAFETAAPVTGGPGSVSQAAGWRRVALASAASIMAGASVATTLTWVAMRPAAPLPPRVSRLALAPSGTAALTINGNDRDLAITPEGSRIVYVGNNGTQLFVRALDTLEPVVVFTGTARGPFVSHDGQWIGFVDTVTMKKVAMTGGPAVTVAPLDGNGPRGATWGSDDTIIVATDNGTTGLQRVAAAGGPTTVLTRPDHTQGESDHLWPELLPGRRAVLFTITAVTGGLDAAQVAVLDLRTGTRKILVRGGSHAQYVPSGPGSPTGAERGDGYLVYATAGTLRAVRFDLARLETRGTPVPVLPAVVTTPTGSLDAVVAGDGTLAYVGGLRRAPITFAWVDRQGRETPIAAPPGGYFSPRLSPEGTRMAVVVADRLAVWDLSRTTFTGATFAPAAVNYPVWTPDGRRLIFDTADRAGVRSLFWQAADGTGAVEQLAESPNPRSPTSVTPDGRVLVFTEFAPNTRNDVMQVTLDGTLRVTPLVQSAFIERNGVVSPDGRWLAYEANDSGRFEVSVRPFPRVDTGHWQVSTGGGTRPLWAPSGQELFYVAPTGALMGVAVARGPSWAAATPTLVIKKGYFTSPGSTQSRTYDIASDGQRFLMMKEGDGSDQTAAPPQIIIVQHWVEELRRLVPLAR